MRAFFDWWFHQLAGLLPKAVTDGGRALPDAVILEADRHEVSISVRQNGAMIRTERLHADEAGMRQLPGTVTELRPRPQRVLVRVSPAQVLQKRLSLPLAARRDLANALNYEIERETPFASEEVYWTYALRRGDSAAASLDVDLILLPRSAIDPFIKAANDAGLKPAGIEVATANGDVALIPLGNGKHASWTRSERSLTPLAMAACVLAVFAGLTPFIVQQWALGSSNATIAALTATARDAAALRQTTDRLAATETLVNKERAQNGSPLAALAALTRALPDDSYLTTASLRAGRLTISGMSPSAAELIGELAQTKEFHEPAFDAPVTQSEGSNLESFTISVSLNSAGAP